MKVKIVSSNTRRDMSVTTPSPAEICIVWFKENGLKTAEYV